MIFRDDLLGFGHLPKESAMSDRPPIQAVEDYTDAFLTTLGVFLFMVFWMIAAALGYLWVAITAYVIDLTFKWVGHLRRE